MLTLRSAPPKASILPSGETSKLVTGFLATVLVFIKFQLCVSHVVMNAFLSIDLFPFLGPPLVVCGVALTIVNRREEVLPRPNRAARKVHFRVFERTGDWMTWKGSTASVDVEVAVLFSLSELPGVCQICIRCEEAPRNIEPSSLKSVSNISSLSKLRSGSMRSRDG